MLEIIKANNLEPSLFEVSEVDDEDGNLCTVVKLINSPLNFYIVTDKEYHQFVNAKYIQFGPKYIESDIEGFIFEDMLEEFEWWISSHVKIYLNELETPDLWEQLEDESVNIFNRDPLSRRNINSFTVDEKELINNSLNKFKELLVIEYKPSDDQLTLIEDRINYLAEGLDRLNKVDWQGIAISTVISISIALNLDTQRGKHLFAIFKQTIATSLEFLK